MAVVIGFSTFIEQGHKIHHKIAGYMIAGLAIILIALIVWIVLRSSNLIPGNWVTTA
jgi:hypothetical protein